MTESTGLQEIFSLANAVIETNRNDQSVRRRLIRPLQSRGVTKHARRAVEMTTIPVAGVHLIIEDHELPTVAFDEGGLLGNKQATIGRYVSLLCRGPIMSVNYFTDSVEITHNRGAMHVAAPGRQLPPYTLHYTLALISYLVVGTDRCRDLGSGYRQGVLDGLAQQLSDKLPEGHELKRQYYGVM